MLTVLSMRRSARLLGGAAVVAAVIGGPAAVSQAAAAPSAVPVAAGDQDQGVVTLDSGSPEGDGSDGEDAGQNLDPNPGEANGADVNGGSATGTNAEIPLAPSDVDLLVRARLAGLWEMPAGRMAEEKGTTQRVRDIGKMIADQHVRLDALTVNAANQVGVQLPTEPNTDQQHWLAEMRAASGKKFDQVFVDRLRDAHGQIFPAIATIRADTRNPIVRQLAIQANGFVGNHLSYLESTDLVDYNSLPEAPQPNNNPLVTSTGPLDAAAARAAQGGISLPIIYALLMTCLIAGAIGVARFLRPRWGAGGGSRMASPMPVRADRPTPPSGADTQGGLRPAPDSTPAYPRPLARPRS